MAIGNINVSTNSKIDNEIEELQNKDNEIINKIGTTDISTIGDGTLTNGLKIIDEELQNNSFGKFAGAINLFDPSLVTGVTWGSSSYTSNGITLTFNSDYTVTIDGTSTALTSLSYIHITDLINKIGKPVKLLNYDFEVEYYEGTTYAGKVMCRGTIPTGKTSYYLYFRVNSGTTFDNLTTNIMLVETSFGDNSADEPFIKSNLQLTNDKAENSTISDEWNSTKTYYVGDYCIYNNSLWKCLVEHTNQIPSNGTYWIRVSVGSEINSIKSCFLNNTVELPTGYIEPGKYVTLDINTSLYVGDIISATYFNLNGTYNEYISAVFKFVGTGILRLTLFNHHTSENVDKSGVVKIITIPK